MISLKDIEKLAELSRLEIPAGEKETLRKEIDSILTYVGQIKEISNTHSSKVKPSDSGLEGLTLLEDRPIVRNVFRDDKNPHESGIYTETLLAETPQREGNFVKVKKIL